MQTIRKIRGGGVKGRGSRFSGDFLTPGVSALTVVAKSRMMRPFSGRRESRAGGQARVRLPRVYVL